jgi:hypothetical protein
VRAVGASHARFSFIEQETAALPTVNPSLWRELRPVVQAELFEVVPGLYQVRTADLRTSPHAARADVGLPDGQAVSARWRRSLSLIAGTPLAKIAVP